MIDELINKTLIKFPSIRNFLYKETWSIPIDIFRILASLLGLVYFASLISEVKTFSINNGLIDHHFFLNNFWWLKINLIQPGLPDNYFYYILGVAELGCLLLLLGIRTRVIPALLFIISTCIQRWNFAVMYVDDSIMHLVFFWLILIPTGRTLNVIDYFNYGNAIFSKWKSTKVPGLALRCFLLNICWIYFFAGITKLTSPLWRDGYALYAILKLPVSYAPDFWNTGHLGFLIFGNYFSIIIEVSLPFLLLYRRNRYLKWLGLLFVLVLNLGIALTLKIPYANIALIASLVLFFRNEIMRLLIKTKNNYELRNIKPLIKSQKVVLVFIITLFFSTPTHVPVLKYISYPTRSVLWMTGIAQNYYLFNWVDRLNYYLDQTIKFTNSTTQHSYIIDINDIIPSTTRHIIWQMRLYNIRWLMVLNKEQLNEHRNDIEKKLKTRICKNIGKTGKVEFITYLHEITPENLDFSKKPVIYGYKFDCI